MINGGEGGEGGGDVDHNLNDDGGGTHADPYANSDPAPPGRFSFDVPAHDDEKYFDKIASVAERLGRPKLSSDYKWNDNHAEFGPLSEEDKGYRSHMAQVFWRTGATQRQVSEYERAQVAYLKTLRAGRAAKQAEMGPRMEQELKKSWGAGAYEGKIRAANQALRGYAGDRDGRAIASLELADGTRLSHHPGFIRLMAAVGESSSPSVRAAGGTPAAAAQEIRRIQNESMAKGLDPTSRSWPHEELTRLYQRAYGDEQLDTSGTRPPGSRAR